jgi:RHS repeat-associated protein
MAIALLAGMLTLNAHAAISISSPANNALFLAPASTGVSASATAPSGSTIVRVEFYANGVLINTDTASPYQFSWTDVPAGTYTLTAKLIDSRGGETTSAARTVTVAAINTAPLIVLNTPATNASYVNPASVPVTVTTSGPEINDIVQRVDFYLNGVLTTTATAYPYGATLTGLANGTYALTAVAVDSVGAQTTSAARTFTVGANQPPTVFITTPLDNSRWHSGASFMFQTQVTGPEVNDTVSVEYFVNGTLAGTRPAAPYNVTVSGLAPGTYTLTARATDGQGLQTTSAARTIVIGATNNPPTVAITSPIANATFAAPASQIVVSVAANPGEVDDSIPRLDIFVNGVLKSTKAFGPFTFNWTNVPAGTYTLTATAVDQYNASTTSAPVTIVVGAPPVALYFIHTDHLDTPRVITNATGQAVWNWDNLSAFGENAPNENPQGQGAFTCNLRFPGQYFDQETGLHYNYFRDYDPGIGRYVQTDPMGLAGGPNLYDYTDANPLGRRDPLGLWSTAAHEYFIEKTFDNLPTRDVNWIKFGSKISDGALYQAARYSYMHAMSSSALSRGQATEQYCKHIEENMKSYRDNVGNAGTRALAYRQLGMALHAAMDSTSPAHRGFQQWSISELLRHGNFPRTEEDRSVAPQYLEETRNLMKNLMNGQMPPDCQCR